VAAARGESAAAGMHADNAGGLVLEAGEGTGPRAARRRRRQHGRSALARAPGVALLKVAHHGSGSSSGARFLARLRPRDRSALGGRAQSVRPSRCRGARRLRASGATMLRTDREGALWFELSEEGVRRIDWRGGRAARGAQGSSSAVKRARRWCRSKRAALARAAPRW
jgi:hypothetical protein